MTIFIPILILSSGSVLRLDAKELRWVSTSIETVDQTEGFYFLETPLRNAFVKKTSQSLRIGRFEILPTGDLRTRWCLPIPAKDTAVLTVSSDFKQVVIEQNRAVSLLRLRGATWQKKRLFVRPVESADCSVSFDASSRCICASINFSSGLGTEYSQVRVIGIASSRPRVLYRGYVESAGLRYQPFETGWSMNNEEESSHTLLRPGRSGYELQVRLTGILCDTLPTVTQPFIKDKAGSFRVGKQVFAYPGNKISGFSPDPVALDNETVLWGSYPGSSFWLNNKLIGGSSEGVVVFAPQIQPERKRNSAKTVGKERR